MWKVFFMTYKKFSSSFLSELKNKSSFPRLLIKAGIKFHGSGEDHIMCLCPFHEDHNASMAINIRNNLFYCHGCHATGNIIMFVQKLFEKDFAAAVAYCQENLFIEGMSQLEDPEKSVDAKKFRNIMDLATLFFYNALTMTNHGVPAMEYLHRRNIPADLIQRFGIGFAPDSWNLLRDGFASKNFSMEDLFACGLIRKKNNRYFDSMRNRIIFPIRDHRGKVLCFHGRRIDDGNEWRFIFTPATRFFDKRKSFFGLSTALSEIKIKEEVIIVEGEFDVLSMHRLGFKNTVSILGSQFSYYHAKILSQYAKRIYFMFDNDQAGRECLLKADEESEHFFEERFYVEYPGKDPDEFVNSNDSDFSTKFSQWHNSIRKL